MALERHAYIRPRARPILNARVRIVHTSTVNIFELVADMVKHKPNLDENLIVAVGPL